MGFLSQAAFWVPTFVVGTLGWIISIVFYRLFLSPIAKVPGPKLAAATGLYEIYFDCIVGGKFTFEVDRLHTIYGPIVRIGPNEVHIADPDYLDELYNMTNKIDKDPRFYRFMGTQESEFATPEHEIHRMKRSQENNFFSRTTVERLEPYVISRFANNLCSRLSEFVKNGAVADLHHALRSFAMDTVTEYSFLESAHFLDTPDFSKSYHLGQDDFNAMIPWMRNIPYLAAILVRLPESLMESPATAGILAFQRHMRNQVARILKGDQKMFEDKAHPTIVSELLASNLPDHDKTAWSLEQKALVIVGAGTATVATNIEAATFYTLENPEIKKKLQDELKTAFPDPSQTLKHRELENLPYLTAVLLESLRLTPGLCGRLPRVNRRENMSYKQYVFPPNTVIGMTPRQIQYDPSIFLEPHDFKPERWLDPTERKRLQKYTAPFGRGSRACIGINVAWAEMYVMFGNMFRRFDMELEDTIRADIVIERDHLTPEPRVGSHGLWVKVVKDFTLTE